MKVFKILFALLIGIVTTTAVCAQVEVTQYFMNSLPQYVSNNPAFIPKYKFSLGLPAMSMMSTGYYNSGFKYNDLQTSVNGEHILQMDKLQKSLPKRTFITTTVDTDLFRFGLLIKPGVFLSINSTARGYTQTMIPKELTGLFVNGNAAYVGSTITLAPAVHMNSWWENAIGLSLSPITNFTFGGRIKMLKGLFNVHTERADLLLSVADNYAMTVSADMKVKTSNIEGIDNIRGISAFKGNNGWAADLGATWKPVPKVTVAASLLDIGGIKWKANTYDFTLDKSKATYTFEGLDMKKLADGDRDYIEQELDSVAKNFEPTEGPAGAYFTGLPTRFFASGSYEVVRNFTVSSALFAQKYPGRLATGWTVGFNKHFGRVISTTVNYSVTNKSFNNLGAGLSLNFAPIQFYVVGDNLLRLPISVAANGRVNEFINSTQVFNFRMGINFVWGWARDKQQVSKGKSPNSQKDSNSTTDTEKHPQPDVVKMRKKKR
jgi:hypothetical protein